MKITVLCGSPKGGESVTLQSVRYLAKRFPGHSFDYVEISSRIAALERDRELFGSAVEKVKTADAVLWCFPVYYLLVPAQFKRFIELVDERGASGAFSGKFAASISTSVHFFDHTAHQYLRSVSEDWGMNWLGFFSAHMEDLLSPRGRKQLEGFFCELAWKAESGVLPQKACPPPDAAPARFDAAGIEEAKKTSPAIVAVFDFSEPEDAGLKSMIAAFIKACPAEVSVYGAIDFKIKGGCLGCIRCGYDNTCAYADGFTRFLNAATAGADAVVFAVPVRDRFFSARFKEFLDRSFFRGHCPVYFGKALALIVSGNFDGSPALLQFTDAFLDNSGAKIAGIACDCRPEPAKALKNLAETVSRLACSRLSAPPTYLTVGAMKIFRDLVYLSSSIFQADKRFYDKYGLLDFPQRDYRKRAFNFMLGLFMRLPAARKRLQADMKKNMVAAHKKIAG